MPPIHTGGGWRVGRQRWRDLLLLHQAVPIEPLRRLVPPALEIDTFEGTAWATLIPFAVERYVLLAGRARALTK